MKPTKVIFKVKNLSKSYPGNENHYTLKDINLDITQGSTIALIGESGSGKSTFLNILSGLEPPTKGEVQFNNVSIWNSTEKERALIRRNELAIIFQSFNLINSLTVWQNIGFHARLSGKWDSDLAEQLIETAGLKNLLNRYPDQISGGEQQRVAILRAIMAKPKVLFADEPTGNLDDQNSKVIIKMLLDMINSIGATLLVATHSKAFASKLDIKLKLKDGKLKS